MLLLLLIYCSRQAGKKVVRVVQKIVSQSYIGMSSIRRWLGTPSCRQSNSSSIHSEQLFSTIKLGLRLLPLRSSAAMITDEKNRPLLLQLVVEIADDVTVAAAGVTAVVPVCWMPVVVVVRRQVGSTVVFPAMEVVRKASEPSCFVVFYQLSLTAGGDRVRAEAYVVAAAARSKMSSLSWKPQRLFPHFFAFYLYHRHLRLPRRQLPS